MRRLIEFAVVIVLLVAVLAIPASACTGYGGGAPAFNFTQQGFYAQQFVQPFVAPQYGVAAFAAPVYGQQFAFRQPFYGQRFRSDFRFRDGRFRDDRFRRGFSGGYGLGFGVRAPGVQLNLGW